MSLPPNRVGRVQAVETCEKAAPDRVHVCGLENRESTPVHVNAKVAVVDDTWACVGSANLDRRSWTHDSELSVAVLDPDATVLAVEASADALDAWHAGGRVGPRPPGRLRRHRPERLGRLTKLWAVSLYRLVHDPDGRPWRERAHGRR